MCRYSNAHPTLSLPAACSSSIGTSFLRQYRSQHWHQHQRKHRSTKASPMQPNLTLHHSLILSLVIGRRYQLTDLTRPQTAQSTYVMRRCPLAHLSNVDRAPHPFFFWWPDRMLQQREIMRAAECGDRRQHPTASKREERSATICYSIQPRQ